MKKILMLIIIPGLFLFACRDLDEIIDNNDDDNPPPPPNTLSKGLLAYWSFDDGTARDFSGNGYDGKIYNRAVSVPGVAGMALKFSSPYYHVSQNGDQGGHVIIPTIDFASMKEFSISLWANDNLDNSTFGECYIFFGDGLDGWVGIGSYKAWLLDNSLKTYFSVGYGNGQQNPPNIINFKYDIVVDKNKWHNYSMVYKNNIVYAYKDGLLIGEKRQAVKISSGRAAIGRHWWFTPEEKTSTRLNCILDEIKIYNRALSQAEINTLSFLR